MLSWLRRRRERADRIDAEAGALMRDLGVDAYVEARQRERAGAEHARVADFAAREPSSSDPGLANARP